MLRNPDAPQTVGAAYHTFVWQTRRDNCTKRKELKSRTGSLDRCLGTAPALQARYGARVGVVAPAIETSINYRFAVGVCCRPMALPAPADIFFPWMETRVRLPPKLSSDHRTLMTLMDRARDLCDQMKPQQAGPDCQVRAAGSKVK